MKKLFCILLCILLLSGCAATYDGPTGEETILTETTRTGYLDGQVSYTQRTVYAYDIHGNLVKERRYWDEKLDTVSSYRYDDRNNRISERHWDHSGLIPLPKSSSKTTYDDQNRILTAVYYNAWGQETSRLTYTYDDEANSYICVDSDGSRNTYYLNDSGKLARLVKDGPGLTYEYIYEYDDRGNHLRTTIYEDGKLYSSLERRFDGQDRRIWQGEYDASGKPKQEITIEYDDEAHTSITHYSWGIHCNYCDPDGRIRRTEESYHSGELSLLIEYTYQQISVPAEGDENP